MAKEKQQINLKKSVYATGRRKTSAARVYLLVAEGEDIQKNEAGDVKANIIVNSQPFDEYFPRKTAQMIIAQPLEVTETKDKYKFVITVRGGGSSGQAGAVRHGIARALERTSAEYRPALKKSGFLTRDSRAVERKKPGRHKARRGTQFSKR